MNELKIETVIREYITRHPGTTINKVVDHLNQKKLLSYVPAYKKIKYLIDTGIIEDRKEGNSFHRLYINDKNQFNLIDKHLTLIEKTLNLLDEPIRKIFRNHTRKEMSDFITEYESFFTMDFHDLLRHTSYMIESQKQAQKLYDRIVKLILKFHNQFPMLYYQPTFATRFFKEEPSAYLKKTGIDGNSINILRKLRDNLLDIRWDLDQ